MKLISLFNKGFLYILYIVEFYRIFPIAYSWKIEEKWLESGKIIK